MQLRFKNVCAYPVKNEISKIDYKVTKMDSSVSHSFLKIYNENVQN